MARLPLLLLLAACLVVVSLPRPAAAASCDGLPEPACGHTPGCVWCVSAAVPSACVTEADAKKLPPAVFDCGIKREGVGLGSGSGMGSGEAPTTQ